MKTDLKGRAIRLNSATVNLLRAYRKQTGIPIATAVEHAVRAYLETQNFHPIFANSSKLHEIKPAKESE